jgi:hypothetical protein
MTAYIFNLVPLIAANSNPSGSNVAVVLGLSDLKLAKGTSPYQRTTCKRVLKSGYGLSVPFKSIEACNNSGSMVAVTERASALVHRCLGHTHQSQIVFVVIGTLQCIKSRSVPSKSVGTERAIRSIWEQGGIGELTYLQKPKRRVCKKGIPTLIMFRYRGQEAWEQKASGSLVSQSSGGEDS